MAKPHWRKSCWITFPGTHSKWSRLSIGESGYEFSEIPTAEDFIEQFNYSVNLVSQSTGNVIFDRCLIDILAYLHVIDPARNIQLLFETAKTIIAEIDLLEFAPIEEPALIDGHQTDQPKLRGLVNDLLYGWITDLSVEAIEVSGIQSDRRDQVLAEIPG